MLILSDAPHQRLKVATNNTAGAKETDPRHAKKARGKRTVRDAGFEPATFRTLHRWNLTRYRCASPPSSPLRCGRDARRR
ncbi:hypothetical protein B0I35DRAFT_421806 [Stachybotrys elegans]|uniref:Uncharacterized protein n=1 Tax=Stachybotrys elegans TaxID=80388 RepID=A0A8K0T175_9HYPO|nr:hypothetical protein B0I35DRAFT_421806 [Stachybotrys elegans]